MSLVAVFHRDRGPRLDEYQWNVADFVDPNTAFWQNSLTVVSSTRPKSP